jgi:hypothetical protein
MNTNKMLGQGACPKGCIGPSSIDNNCSKEIIKQVIDGHEKYFRMCTKVCRDRNDPKYVNYDNSDGKTPYDPIKHGCRDTQAHCVGKCNKVLLEVRENGMNLEAKQQDYRNAYKIPQYNKSKIYTQKATTNMFGDNRPRTGYRFNYKPENPDPSVGPVHNNSMWGMKL